MARLKLVKFLYTFKGLQKTMDMRLVNADSSDEATKKIEAWFPTEFPEAELLGVIVFETIE